MEKTALEQLAEDVAKWRETRRSVREYTPKVFKSRARALAGEFSEAEICRRLLIPRRRLFPKVQAEPKFIELPVVAAGPAVAPPAPIEVIVQQGARTITVRLPGGTPLSALLPLLKP